MIEFDGEIQLAFGRIAQWKRQREEARDVAGLVALAEELEAQRQAAEESIQRAGALGPLAHDREEEEE